MNPIPKITLDTNCVINLLDFSAKTPTSVDILPEIIQYGLSSKADIAITTRVEADLLNDKDNNRKSEMLRKIQMLPIVGTLGRFGTTKWNSGDIYTDKKTQKIWLELQMLIFPGLTEADPHFINKRNDIDHLIGNLINKRDIFVTDDKGILKKKDALRTSPGIIVMSPKNCLDYLLEIKERNKKYILQSEKKNVNYHSPALTGKVTFDYSNNNGYYTIGEGYFLFETKWSSASQDSIHAYSGSGSIETIALVKGITDIKDLKDCSIFDSSSYCRTPDEGQIIVLKNKNNIYAAVKVIDIKYDGRDSDDKDEITFEYIIQSDGSANFNSIK